ncbi:cytochrome P450 2D15-like isoform X2 [Apostichopus japonicus]|uniref:cytochrome P450 2D15-like isoform X2 n=1 Tax=Stichopus japonicus TaxID=307972 RepID=UPI003AB721C5
MHWSVMLLCEFPDIQEKVGEEVDRIVGWDRLPSLDDREKLTYTTATLYEVMRFSSILPLSVPHATSKEVQIEGTWVLFNLFSMHYDDKLWNEPETFKPEHFLDETGKVRLHPEGFLPFSTGRRVCLGESLAKAELFLLFSWLFQHYRVRKSPGQEDKDYSESTFVAFGSLPQNYKVVVEKRF